MHVLSVHLLPPPPVEGSPSSVLPPPAVAMVPSAAAAMTARLTTTTAAAMPPPPTTTTAAAAAAVVVAPVAASPTTALAVLGTRAAARQPSAAENVRAQGDFPTSAAAPGLMAAAAPAAIADKKPHIPRPCMYDLAGNARAPSAAAKGTKAGQSQGGALVDATGAGRLGHYVLDAPAGAAGAGAAAAQRGAGAAAGVLGTPDWRAQGKEGMSVGAGRRFTSLKQVPALLAVAASTRDAKPGAELGQLDPSTAQSPPAAVGAANPTTSAAEATQQGAQRTLSAAVPPAAAVPPPGAMLATRPIAAAALAAAAITPGAPFKLPAAAAVSAKGVLEALIPAAPAATAALLARTPAAAAAGAPLKPAAAAAGPAVQQPTVGGHYHENTTARICRKRLSRCLNDEDDADDGVLSPQKSAQPGGLAAVSAVASSIPSDRAAGRRALALSAEELGTLAKQVAKELQAHGVLPPLTQQAAQVRLPSAAGAKPMAAVWGTREGLQRVQGVGSTAAAVDGTAAAGVGEHGLHGVPSATAAGRGGAPAPCYEAGSGYVAARANVVVGQVHPEAAAPADVEPLAGTTAASAQLQRSGAAAAEDGRVAGGGGAQEGTIVQLLPETLKDTDDVSAAVGEVLHLLRKLQVGRWHQ